MAEVKQTPQTFQPGFRLFDGTALNAAFAQIVNGTDDAAVPSTTQTRLGGTAVAYGITRCAAANGSDAFTLGANGAGSVIPAGAVFLIANKSGATVQVFPPGANDKIDGGTAGAAVNLTTAKIGIYIVTANIGGVLTLVSGSMAVST